MAQAVVTDIRGHASRRFELISDVMMTTPLKLPSKSNFPVNQLDRLRIILSSAGNGTLSDPTKRLQVGSLLYKSLHHAIENYQLREKQLQSRMKEVRDVRQSRRISTTSIVAALQYEINSANFSISQQRTRRTIARRNSNDIVDALKQNLSDVPDDKEELEEETQWDVAMQMKVMKKRRKGLRERLMIIRAARKLVNPKYSSVTSKCADITDDAEISTAAMARMVLACLPVMMPSDDGPSVLEKRHRKHLKREIDDRRGSLKLGNHLCKDIVVLRREVKFFENCLMQNAAIRRFVTDSFQRYIKDFISARNNRRVVMRFTQASSKCHQNEKLLEDAVVSMRWKYVAYLGVKVKDEKGGKSRMRRRASLPA